jgi:phenylalanyl-tRNA synthetase beta chain
MIISVNWLKKYTDIDLSIDELTTLIGSRLVEIEQVIDLGKKYEGVVIAKVVECKPLEGSDHLNITKIDDGGVVETIERDENGHVQVVCGAPNVREGLTVAWLPPGSTVPETYGKDPFVLSAKPLRGVVSNGMLASAKELDLWDDHTGIIVLEDSRKAGESFAKAYELDDYLLDIENKSLTHRPDTFGIVGFAREVAGIQGKPFKTPERLTLGGVKWLEKTGDLPTPKVTIDNPELSSRYQAVVLTNVDCKIALSPIETQTYLARVGVRPHSAVVDVTNYMMMITGQPLHAFDYDKLKAVNNGEIDIHVRGGHEGEKLVLLDGREIELSENDIVIANGETVVALAGAMGGRDTEIDETTTSVLLESASFNLYNLRNTQFRHGIFSEAITRFTKGQPAELTAPVLAGAVDLMHLAAGAEVASDVADTYPVKQEQPKVYAMAEHMNAALGTEFATDDIVRTLTNVEFDVSVNDEGLITAVAPYWRADIHISEDLDEEVGRLNGFDTITPTLPARDFTPVSPDSFDQFRALVRQVLARAGANEVLTYSFVHGDLFKKAEQNVENAYRIVNSISPDLQYYRLSLTPNLLSLVHPNRKNGFNDFALFELNKTHNKVVGMDDSVPKEIDLLALVVTGTFEGAVYYQAKRLLDYLGTSLQLTFDYRPIGEDPGYDESAPFDYRRSAMVYAGETYIGIIGEYKAAVRKAFKLDGTVAGFELDPRALHAASLQAASSYTPLSRYPSTERDICFQVGAQTKYVELEKTVKEGIDTTSLAAEISALDIYQPESGDTKNITFRIKLTPYDKTLTGDEVTAVMNVLIDYVSSKLGATVV